MSRQCSGGGWRSRHYYTRPVPALTSLQPQHEFGQRLQSQVSELQADGGQGEGDEETRGEAGQVGKAGDTGGDLLTLSLQLESGEGLKESFTQADN